MGRRHTTDPQSTLVFVSTHTHTPSQVSAMKPFISLLLPLLLRSALAGENCQRKIESVETACEYPHKLTLISSPTSLMVDSDNCNDHFQKTEWQKEPTVMFPDAEAEKMYTLLNVDPDAPGYENGQYYLHWLVSNIKGEHFSKGDLSKAERLVEYVRPNPPSGSGEHRYMFLAFEQDEQNEKLENPSGRSKFELAPWLERQNGLKGPVAGIQFRTKF